MVVQTHLVSINFVNGYNESNENQRTASLPSLNFRLLSLSSSSHIIIIITHHLRFLQVLPFLHMRTIFKNRITELHCEYGVNMVSVGIVAVQRKEQSCMIDGKWFVVFEAYDFG